MIRSILVLALVAWISAGHALAATFKLTDGRTVTGELVETGSDDSSALINAGEGRYERVPWGQFSQDDLKVFVEKYKANKKIYEAVEPFIEVTAEERAARTEVKIEPAPEVVQELQKGRLEPKGSTIASLLKSPVGLFLVVIIFAANIYAGFEIAVFRARPKALVAGLAAIPGLGFLSNIIFLSMPTQMEGQSEEDLAAAQAERLAPTPTIEIPGAAEAAAAQQQEAVQAAAEGPKAEVFSRGKFTFNKRFFETKFAGFFGMTRNDENKPKVLIVKCTKGDFVVERITRVTPGDLYIQAVGVIGETSMHFGEITEVILKPHA
jgi:hypothetical protein